MCAKGELHSLKSEIRTASLIGDWESVPSNTDLAAVHLSETDTAGAQNDNTSIVAPVCPQASHVRVTCKNQLSKRMWEAEKRFTGSLAINSS
jgi:hypothetical protein